MGWRTTGLATISNQQQHLAPRSPPVPQLRLSRQTAVPRPASPLLTPAWDEWWLRRPTPRPSETSRVWLTSHSARLQNSSIYPRVTRQSSQGYSPTVLLKLVIAILGGRISSPAGALRERTAVLDLCPLLPAYRMTYRGAVAP